MSSTRRESKRRQFARLEEAVVLGQLVGLEVTGWTGSQPLGGWGGSSHPEQVALRHGDPERDNTRVSLTTLYDERAVVELDWHKNDLFQKLLRREEQPPKDLDAGDLHRWFIEQKRRIEGREPVKWSSATMTVDGVRVPGDVIHRADRWIAVAAIGGVTVEIMTRGLEVDAAALNRVLTLHPYVQGRRKLREAHHREHERLMHR